MKDMPIDLIADSVALLISMSCLPFREVMYLPIFFVCGLNPFDALIYSSKNGEVM